MDRCFNPNLCLFFSSGLEIWTSQLLSDIQNSPQGGDPSEDVNRLDHIEVDTRHQEGNETSVGEDNVGKQPRFRSSSLSWKHAPLTSFWPIVILLISSQCSISITLENVKKQQIFQRFQRV